MKLYFITGDNNELFIWSTSTEYLADMWNDYYTLTGVDVVTDKDLMVFEIPVTSPSISKALGWHTDVREILL